MEYLELFIFSMFSPLIMGTGKRWKWQLVTWPHSKIPSVRAVFSGRVCGFWREGAWILAGGRVDSEGSACEF
jgi:hypothetical protein